MDDVGSNPTWGTNIMPTYVYRCNECDEETEVVQRFSDDPISDCEKCGSSNCMRKVISAAKVVFVGKGFYVNDSRSSEMKDGSIGG